PAMKRLAALSEDTLVNELIHEARFTAEERASIENRAAGYVATVRKAKSRFGGLDDFLQEFGLTTKEGVALMCLAEALLRIPDKETADALMRDKLADINWSEHVGESERMFVNASTWALMLTGKVLQLDDEDDKPAGIIGRLVSRSGEPVIRAALTRAMKLL